MLLLPFLLIPVHILWRAFADTGDDPRVPHPWFRVPGRQNPDLVVPVVPEVVPVPEHAPRLKPQAPEPSLCHATRCRGLVQVMRVVVDKRQHIPPAVPVTGSLPEVELAQMAVIPAVEGLENRRRVPKPICAYDGWADRLPRLATSGPIRAYRATAPTPPGEDQSWDLTG